MQLTAKLVSVFMLLLLSSPIFLFNSCGGNGNTFFSGGACGGCPNSTAPDGSTIVSNVASLTTAWDSFTGDTQFAGCMDSISFTVRDAAGKPLDNICTEFFTNGYIALSDPNSAGSCVYAPTYAHNYMRQRTNKEGTITVSYANIVSKGTASTGTATTADQFIQVTSCSATKKVDGTWTINWK